MSLDDAVDAARGDPQPDMHGTPASPLEYRFVQLEERLDRRMRNLDERVNGLQGSAAEQAELKASVRRAFKRIGKLEDEDRTSYGERASLREMVSGFRESVEDLSGAIKELTLLPERVARLESTVSNNSRGLWMLAGGLVTISCGVVIAAIVYWLGIK